MFFEAKLKNKHYRIHVKENRKSWIINLQEGDGEWDEHQIDKRHYQQLEQAIVFLFNGSSYIMDVVGADTHYTVYTRGSFRKVTIFNDEMLLHESLKKGGGIGSEDKLSAGMPGKISKLFVKKGDTVEEGAPLLVMEAMKMENEMKAPKKVKIKKIHIKKGDNVENGTLLISYY